MKAPSFLAFSLCLRATSAFTHHASFTTCSRRTTPLFSESEKSLSGETSTEEQQNDLFASLKARQDELEQGIGKRYRVRTQIGFLNVHSAYEEGPYAVDNIVNQLEEGEIVTSTGSRVQDWIPHDHGGWSIARFGGFTWLEPLEGD